MSRQNYCNIMNWFSPGSPQSETLAADFPKAAEQAVYAMKPLEEGEELVVENLVSKPLVSTPKLCA
jgi:hypothetical protein